MWLKLFLLFSIFCASTSRSINVNSDAVKAKENGINSNGIPQHDDGLDAAARNKMDLNENDGKLLEFPHGRRVKKDINANWDSDWERSKKQHEDWRDNATKWTVGFIFLAIVLPIFICCLIICAIGAAIYFIAKPGKNRGGPPPPPVGGPPPPVGGGLNVNVQGQI